MPQRPKNKQNRPYLPFSRTPVALSGDFPVSCSDVFVQRDQPITRLHCHDAPEIGFCHSGTGIWVVGTKIMTFSQGDVIFISAEQVHLAQSSPGTVSEWTWIYFDPLRLFGLFMPALAGGALDRLSGPHFHNLFARSAHERISRTVQDIIAEFRSSRSNHREAVAGLLYTLLAMLRREGTTWDGGTDLAVSARHDRLLERITPAVECICGDYGRDIRVKQLASLCFMSVTNFRRTFTAALGKTPQEYLASVRISMAGADLRSGDRKVSQVALDNGFTTLSAFNRMFRKLTGKTPRQWRRGPDSV